MVACHTSRQRSARLFDTITRATTAIFLQLASEGSYDGAPIDVWGSGIILFTLLVGSTPWDEATQNAPEYVKYLDGSIWEEEPWSRIRGSARGTSICVFRFSLLKYLSLGLAYHSANDRAT